MIPNGLFLELMCQTVLEQLLIAIASPIGRAHRLEGGQRVFSDHILNMARDVAPFATSLPWRANSEEIPIIVIVSPQGWAWEVCELEASRQRVERALIWLIGINPAHSASTTDIG
ncbi:unnamed protein product [Hapterophycus canaliculatus]